MVSAVVPGPFIVIFLSITSELLSDMVPPGPGIVMMSFDAALAIALRKEPGPLSFRFETVIVACGARLEASFPPVPRSLSCGCACCLKPGIPSVPGGENFETPGV